MKDQQSVPATPTINDAAKQQHARDLLEDALIMAEHAISRGLHTEEGVHERLTLLKNRIEPTHFDEQQMVDIVKDYQHLSHITGAVSATSLRATQHVSDSYWKSRTGRHLLKLWGITTLVGALIFLYSMLEYRVSYYDINAGGDAADELLFWVRLQHYATFLVPFIYGALGACAYLLRVVEQKIKSREFDPNRIPEHWNRLALGGLSGGMIVMFINQMPDNGGTSSVVQISEGALGFLAGYSIDFLFSTLDRIVNALMPKSQESSNDKRRQAEKNKLVNQYQDRLNKSKDQTEQKTLKEIIDDLRR